ncbi:MAG: glycosyltransferase [Planctomycetes bacterium]|nr:glycosyltransferase [Planctomycetota bacterium]
MPKLSVIIAAFNNISLLKQCLTSLKGQWERRDTEVFVATNYRDGVKQMLERQFPQVKHLCFSAETTVPELRTQGILHTTGEIVVLTEDHCIFDNHWCSEIKKAHESSYPIIGGCVENASERLLDWAVYFHDYGKYMLPNSAGVVKTLSGINVSYKRLFLNRIEDTFRKGFFETFIHSKLTKEGDPLYLAPSAIVYHNKSYKIKEAFTQCYHHGRSFGAMRISSASFFKRLSFVLGSTILPLLLPLRIALGILKKGRHIKELLLSFPCLVLLMTSWSYGEFCGYLCGEGGSAARWK